MTGQRPSGRPVPFTPSELDGASGVHTDELAEDTRIARDLELLAAQTTNPRPAASAAFADRVMGAIAAEPFPAPARLAGLALRRHSISSFLLSIRDAWRVMTSVGFPIAARAQAMALVLVVAALVTGSSMVTAGALGLLGNDHAGPSPSIEQPSGPVETPTETNRTTEPSENASTSPDASESPTDASTGPEAASPGNSVEDHGSSGGSSGGGHATSTPTRTPEPTASDHGDHSPWPFWSPRPGETPHPSGSHGD